MLLNRRRSPARRKCRGMTLLELVLSLALSALLLMAISMALHIHWKAFDVKRSRVEEAQLASAILRSISDDIRGTLKFEPPNLEGLDLGSLASNALGAAASSAMSGGGGTSPSTGSPINTVQQQQQNTPQNQPNNNQPTNQPNNNQPTNQPNQNQTVPNQPSPNQTVPNQPSPNQTSNNQTSNSPQNTAGGGMATVGTASAGGGTSPGTGTGNTSGGVATSEGETAEASGPSVVVGLYGSATQLQFDVSRLPRVDQYQVQENEDGSVQIPSDIKTVVYFLAGEDSASGTGTVAMAPTSQTSTTGTGRGLMRAESDRAASAYGELSGSTDSLYAGAKLLAAEVTSLQFQYFDGTEWLAEWNSDDQGGLPTAIEVVLTIGAPQNSQSTTPPVAAGTSAAEPVDPATRPTYRMVVQLPVGGISPSTEESTETTESASAASGVASGTTPGGGTMP